MTSVPRALTVMDPKLSTTTTYNYDGVGNLASQVSPDTGTTGFTYDAAGNVLTQTDARSTVTTYGYDVLNRVTAATVTDGAVTYEYDNTTTGGPYAVGRLTKVTDPSGNTTYGYDALGRVISKVQTVTANPANKIFAVGYAYSNGRQTGITYPSGHALTYGFDAQGRIASIVVDGTTVLASAAYVPFGGVESWTWGNGEPYDRTFDLDGRVKTVTIGPAAGVYPDLSEVFGYDSLNRLLTANLAAGQTQSFTYDANGNRTNATINAASTTYTYPTTSHRLSSLSGATTRSFTYDNAGNLASSAGITYTYDGRGRTKQAGTATYAINELGQRVKKNNGTDVFFAYDEAGHLIGEYDATGAPIEETVWLGDLPVAVMKPNGASFDVFYVWSDNLGTPREITDTANQERWEWPNADPFGNNLPNENPAGLGVFTYNLRFPGQYYDAEKGSNYNYFRDYDPSIGRYIESDPVSLKGGLNTYAYVSGNPILAWDDFGLCATIIRAKTHWQFAWDHDEVMFGLNLTMPVYHWESHFSFNRGIFKNPSQPPMKPSVCYRYVGDDVTTIELMHNVQFWQNIAYQQTCSTCATCGGGDGPMTCGDWKDIGAIDAREITSTPWLRTRRSFNEVSGGPCVKFPFMLPGMGR